NPNAEDGLDKVYKQILDMVKSHLGKSKELSAEEEEVKILLSKAIRNLTTGENLKIRYIPPNRMQHFTIRPRRFFPYGESLFYKSTFPAKLLIALETAVTVRRISDSSEKRLIYYETGLPRQGRDIIETIRETLTKRKVSVDTMGSVGTIPSMLTSFEEIYLPQKDGKRHVEFDKLEPQTNIRDATDELKYFRDKIIASLNVPPPFLSLEENISNKNALTHESDLFARSIISYQQTFSTHLKSLFSKMYQLTFKERMVGVNVSLPVPKLLQIEREADHYENVNRIAEVLKGFEVPFNYVREKYLSFDWEEIEKYKRRDQLEKHRSLDKGQDDGSGDETGGFGQGM
ncbi:MAG: portal protein, partial [archaeon]